MDAGRDCPHAVLAPHWDNMADMGELSRANSFRCNACGREFTPSEALELRATEGDRVRHLAS
jgi:hypothetical protein